MKKILIVVGSLIVAIGVILISFNLGSQSGKNTVKKENSSSISISKTISGNLSSSSSSEQKNVETQNNYDPNKTLDGTKVDGAMIQKVTKELDAAGLPADMWAPSDIKNIITKSSQQGISAVEYAKQNYHQ